MNFYEFASWLNSYLASKGYSINYDNENRNYYLAEFSYFWISYKRHIIYFHREFYSLNWAYMDFNDNPNTEVYMNLFKKLADEFIIEEKRRIMRVKMRKINDDF